MGKAYNAYSYETVKEFIESKGCELLSKEYISNKEKLEIKCKCGNVFKRTFKKFKNSDRFYCNICTGKMLFTEDEVEDIFKNLNIKPLGEFFFTKKIKFKCLNCGKDFYGNAGYILKNNKNTCNCTALKKRYDYDQVKEFIKENSNCELISKDFENIDSNLDLRCGCGDLFSTTFKKFKYKNKRQCDTCSGHKIYTYEEVKKYIESYGNILLTLKDEYKHTKQHLDVMCGLCGETFKKTYSDFMQSVYKNCKKCSFKEKGKNARLTHEYVFNFIKENDCELLSEYKTAKTILKIKCSCGEIFKTNFNEFNSGFKRQCNHCSKTISNGERYFQNFLNNNNINYIFQKKFKDCRHKAELPFDFYLKDLNVCIEIDGWLHREYNEYFHKTEENFKEVKLRDKIKDDYCRDNNIILYRIKYDKISDIEDWIEKNKELILNG